MTEIVFLCYLILGTVQPTDTVDGRQTYTVCIDDVSIEHAYKGEILNWIDSGKFIYNENLED